MLLCMLLCLARLPARRRGADRDKPVRQSRPRTLLYFKGYLQTGTPSVQSMPWSELAAELQTGDVMLFHQDGLISSLIELVTEAHFSHVAMVVREDDGGLKLWQSFEPDGGVVSSDVLPFLQRYTSNYKGVYIDARRLQVDRTADFWAPLPAFVKEMTGRPFPSALGMAVRYFEGRLGIDSGEKEFFCSDLVADTYMQVGLLKKKPPPNYYAPRSFSAYRDIELQLGASYSDHIRVELPSG